MKQAILTIKYNRGSKLINLHESFFFDHKNRLLSNQQLHEKVLSIVQDDLKIKYVPKEVFTFKLLK